jgi:HAD superfamily hydrolase (TIGR01509 family)
VFRAALLDYNGVLVDDELVHLAAFQDTVRPLGIRISERDYRERYLGYDDAGAFRAMLQDAGREAPDELVRTLIEAKRPVYLSRADSGLQTFAGAAEVVSVLAAAGPIAVVSGALRDEIELGLRVLGVRDLVGHVVSAEDTRQGKPDPEGYLLGLRWLRGVLGHETSEVLVIEDSLSGVEAAKLARLTCLAVEHSYSADELRHAGADEVVPSIEQVSLGLLEDLHRRTHGHRRG